MAGSQSSRPGRGGEDDPSVGARWPSADVGPSGSREPGLPALRIGEPILSRSTDLFRHLRAHAIKRNPDKVAFRGHALALWRWLQRRAVDT